MGCVLMVVNLQKGQRVDLTKGNAGLNRIIVGLGWDPVEQKRGWFSSAPAEVDCDASVLMLQNDRLFDNQDVVYFGRLKSACGSVIHSGDNLTGEGDGDDETIIVSLNDIPTKYNKLVFAVNIYDAHNRKQHFGMIRNAYIRIINPANNQELIRYNLSDDYHNQTALITGEIYRHNTEWKFAALGNSTQDRGLADLCARFT